MKKPVTQDQAKASELAVARALSYLGHARDQLKEAGCPKTLARVRLAISSAKGALRNAGYRVTRTYYTERRNNGET